MRKYLIVALAAFTAVALATVSFAQGGDTFTLDTKVTPTKAGKPRKAKNANLDLNIVNGNTQRTMSALDIYLPKTMKISLRGMPKCAPDVIFARACPSRTVLGRGEAKAKVGVNGPPENVTDLTFEVTAYSTNSPVTGKPMLGFFIDDGGTLQFLTETTLKKARGKFRQRLHIDVPELAQRVGATYNGLVSLRTTLGKKVGRRSLQATTGCVRKKHNFKVELTFIDNGVTDATKLTKTSTSRCKR